MVLPSDVLEYRDYSYENFTTIRLKKKESRRAGNDNISRLCIQ